MGVGCLFVGCGCWLVGFVCELILYTWVCCVGCLFVGIRLFRLL